MALSNDEKQRLISTQEFDFRLIKVIRQMRNKTLQEWAELMNINFTTLSRLENNDIEFTPYYYRKMKDAMRKVRFSKFELETAKRLAEYRRIRGYSY